MIMISSRLAGLLVLLAVMSGCSGPLPFMSGGQLDGEERPAPGDWTLEEDFGLGQLETRPDDPYSVNIAYTIVEGQLYINAGDTETEWVKHMDANPLVRLRISDALYPLRAERVQDPSEISAFGKVWVDQSVFHRDPDGLDEVWIYRMVAR
jgi:hypothetical protein